MKDLVFSSLFTPNLLFYSWNQLKNSDYLSSSSSFSKFPAFSALWFKRTSSLIKNNSFIYGKKTKIRFVKYKQKRYSINILSQMIIELSFVNVIIICKKKFLDFDLVKCLRYFKGKLFSFLLTTFLVGP